jgi:WD40 repeat protein
VACDVMLDIAARAPGEFDLRIESPAGSATRVMALDVPALLAGRATLAHAVLESGSRADREVASESPRPLRDHGVLRAIGTALFEALLAGPVLDRYRDSVAQAEATHGRDPVRLVLRLRAAELAPLPWEALFDPELGEYVCQRDSVLRYVSDPLPATSRLVEAPMRILGLVASPRDLSALDAAREQQLLHEALAAQIDAGAVELAWADAGDWATFQSMLMSGSWQVVHFIGHGGIDDEGRAGLALEDGSSGSRSFVSAWRFARLLRASRPQPRLVVLNSCCTAESQPDDLLSSTAASLVHRGISAVAAMQFPISDRAAVAFARGFYQALAYSKPVDEAVRLGRLAITGLSETTVEWVTPVLYLRTGETRLFTLPSVTELDEHVLAAALAPCPYRGLVPFQEQDAHLFFGREREARRLEEQVDRHPVVLVTGQSGSGKSSLVRASLWPRLRGRGCRLVDLRPVVPFAPRVLLRDALAAVLGPDWAQRPLDEPAPQLGEALVASGERVVLFVDQFEEAVAADPDAARELFALITALARTGRDGAAPPPVGAVFTMRTTAIDQLLTADLGELVDQRSVHLLPMGREHLLAAIGEPARSVGVTFEVGLPERIVDDALDIPGQLPLLEYALTRLWEHQQVGVLTHEGYDRIGAVTGALADDAERIYEQVPVDVRPAVRRLLECLAVPTDDNGFILAPRRLDQLSLELRDVADLLSQRRLVVIREDPGQPAVVALVHEALIHGWRRLREWLEADRDFLVWRERLSDQVAEWKDAAGDPGRLLRGTALEEAEQYVAERSDDLTRLERDFVAASRSAVRCSVRRWRTVAAVMGVQVLLVAGLGIATFAANRDLAAELRRQAAFVLAAESLKQAETDPLGGLQLALAAWHHDRDSPDAYAAMMLQQARLGAVRSIRPAPWPPGLRDVASNGDGSVIAVSHHDGAVAVWYGLLGDEPRSRPLDSRIEPQNLTLSSDGGRLAVSGPGGALEVWNTHDGTRPLFRPPVDTPGVVPPRIRSERFSPDGRHLALAWTPPGGDVFGATVVHVYDTVTDQQVPSAIGPATGARAPEPALVEAGGATVWLKESGPAPDGSNVVRDVATGALLRELPTGRITRDGSIAYCVPPASLDRSLKVWDGATGGERLGPAGNLCENIQAWPRLDVTERVAEVGRSGSPGESFKLMELVDLRTGARSQLVAPPLPDPTTTSIPAQIVQPGAEGPELTVIGDRAILRFQPAVSRDGFDAAMNPSTRAVYSRDGRLVASSQPVPEKPFFQLQIHELPSLRPVFGAQGTPLADVLVQDMAFTPDGRRLVIVSRERELIVLTLPGHAIEARIRVADPPNLPGAEEKVVGGRIQGSSLALVDDDEVAVHSELTISRWRISTGEQLGGPLSADAEPDEQSIVVKPRPGHSDQVLTFSRQVARLWDLRRGRPIWSRRPDRRATIESIAFLDDSLLLQTGNGLEEWSTDQGEPVAPAIAVPELRLAGVGPAGEMIMTTTSTPTRVEVWDRRRARRIAALDPAGFAFDRPDMIGTRLVGLSSHKLVNIELDRERWRAHLCSLQDRDYTDAERQVLPPGTEPGPPCRLDG